ncbi:hypothetical protein LEN26_011591 [Aphanomyces euteiches]|nr:hypothetical protein LEN26_011591 [Aphanomyces euteiches]KAH9194949.1 hypothetical protein AeNC1_003057 [Aphanomyces euteiches]
MEAASDKKTPTSYSFSCSGWLQCYQYGVGKALQELNLHQDAISLGASAGTLAAMTLTINKDFDVMLHHLQRGCTLAHAAIREWVIDGGLFEYQPILDANTVTVCPLYFSKADIRPSQYVPVWWGLLPGDPIRFQWLYHLGKYDAYQWALKHGYTTKTYIPPMRVNELPFQTKVGNFFGYKSMDNRLLDIFFVASVAIVWKPVAFFLVYAELLLCAFGQAAESMKTIASNVNLSLWIVASSLVLGFTFTAMLLPLRFLDCLSGTLCLLLVYCAVQLTRNDKAYFHWECSLNYLRAMFNLKLFIQTIPFVGSVIPSRITIGLRTTRSSIVLSCRSNEESPRYLFQGEYYYSGHI